MHYQRMAEIQDELFERIRKIRETKGREYATDEDTLADFKEVAAECGTTPLQCWATYVKKHERAIDAYIREGSVKSESINDRILDVIVYHILLLGLIEDLHTYEAVLRFDDVEVARPEPFRGTAPSTHSERLHEEF